MVDGHAGFYELITGTCSVRFSFYSFFRQIIVIDIAVQYVRKKRGCEKKWCGIPGGGGGGGW